MKHLLAYWDTFGGLIPCKVIRTEPSPDPEWTDVFGHKYIVVAELTADRGPYRKGQRIAQSPTHVWPRDCAKPKRGTYGQTYIVTEYDWETRLST